jgi:hypothetical protein
MSADEFVPVLASDEEWKLAIGTPELFGLDEFPICFTCGHLDDAREILWRCQAQQGLTVAQIREIFATMSRHASGFNPMNEFNFDKRPNLKKIIGQLTLPWYRGEGI